MSVVDNLDQSSLLARFDRKPIQSYLPDQIWASYSCLICQQFSNKDKITLTDDCKGCLWTAILIDAFSLPDFLAATLDHGNYFILVLQIQLDDKTKHFESHEIYGQYSLCQLTPIVIPRSPRIRPGGGVIWDSQDGLVLSQPQQDSLIPLRHRFLVLKAISSQVSIFPFTEELPLGVFIFKKYFIFLFIISSRKN